MFSAVAGEPRRPFVYFRAWTTPFIVASTEQTNDSPMPNDSSERTEASSNGAEAEADAEASSEVEALEARIEELEAERDELNDRLLRKAAEFDNYRRRMDREKTRRYEAGKLEVIEPMLEVLDDFERSLDAAQELRETQDAESAYESLRGGVEMVFRKLRDELRSLGVEPIEAEGEPFDEQLHEAMMRQPSEEAEPNTVLQEIRKGYTLDDRIIRHSRVVVSSEPPSDTPEDDG